MKNFISKNFQLILIFILMLGLVFTYNKFTNEKQEHQRLLDQINVEQTVDSIEQPGLPEIKEREKAEYKLNKELDELKKKIEIIKKEKQKESKVLEDLKHEIQKANINTINSHFLIRNYSTSVILK